MPIKTVKQEDGKKGKKRVSCIKTAKIKKYHEIITFSPQLPKTVALVQAGYSTGTKAEAIESTQYFKQLQAEHQQVVDSLKLPIDQRIKEAQERTGFTAARVLARMQQILDNGKDRDAAAAGKLGTEITGERLPERIDHNITGDDTLLSKLCNE